MGKKLIPGLESYMTEENDIDVEVNVGDPAEVAEEETEAVEANTEVEAADGEMQEEAQEAEMIFQRYDELERMQAHIQKFGVSREFMAWHNWDGSFAESLGLTIPAVESMDAVGDPYSQLSIACMEGIGDALRSVWEFIKKVCKKIVSFFSRIAEAVVRTFSSLDSNVGRLRKAADDRTKDLDKIKNYEASMWKEKTLTDYFKKIEDMQAKMNNGQTFGQIKQLVIQTAKDFETNVNATNYSGGAQTIKQRIEALDNEDKKKFGGDKDKFKLPDRPNPSNMKFEPNFNVENTLKYVSDKKRSMDAVKAVNQIVKDTMQTVLGVVQKAEKRDDDGAKDEAKDIRRLMSLANRVASREAKFTSDKMWVLNKLVRMCSIFVVNCMKKV